MEIKEEEKKRGGCGKKVIGGVKKIYTFFLTRDM